VALDVALDGPALDYLSAPGVAQPRGWLASRLRRWHLWLAVAFWLAFSGLSLFIVLKGLDRAADHPRTVAATVAATALGPMVGAVSRDFQGCCLEASLSLLPYCLGGLLIGLAVQLVVRPGGWFAAIVRVVAWIAGLLMWFGGGIISFAHALS
jgi:hypothetical protein